MTAPCVLLTGASGAGKTTLAQHFLEHDAARCDVFFFDSIGVPSAEEMEIHYGSGEAWQLAMTMQWVSRIRPVVSSQKPVLFEGQMRIAFIQEALAAQELKAAQIILIDCDDATRTARLRGNRSQPELANPVMMHWARYLRNEALALGVEILDTSHTPFEDCVAYLRSRLFRESLME